MNCRYFKSGKCSLGRWGGEPGPGVCAHCQRIGRDRIMGAGDRVRLILDRPVHRWMGRWWKPRSNCGGCVKRQRALNRIFPSKGNA